MTLLVRGITQVTMRRLLAVSIGKLIIFLSRLLKRGGGSACSGLVALIIDPNLIAGISRRLPGGAIVVTGTNGKTTTAKFLSEILERSNLRVITNRSGSNLARGIAATLIEQSSIWGWPKGDIGLFEVDEATMPEVVPAINPTFVLVTNLFRDQLDRYGELDKTAGTIAGSFKYLKEATVILNADDPLVASLAKDVSSNIKTVYFGLEDNEQFSSSGVSLESSECVLCGHELSYKKRYFAQMGDYKCPHCNFLRPEPLYVASETILQGITKSTSSFSDKDNSIAISLNLAGIFNIYNALGAYSIAKALGIADELIKQSLEMTTAAFGRMEKLQFKGRTACLLLTKNPVGLTQLIEILATDKEAKNFLFCLNDNLADGTDISWIWDADIEALDKDFKTIFCSGSRAYDMALRLKYAGLDVGKIEVIQEIVPAFEKAVEGLNEHETLYVLPTYTAMLEIRNYLTRAGIVAGFWEMKL
ncbi:MAG TPA: MurT ligase domain-containing protein [Candidatus Aquicultor sp.]|jgi:UDP-N-acetylmuramyl tripeptide synthase